MNLSRLLRTALFSALGLLVAGGLMTVQAQTADIIVDEDEADSPPNLFDTISEGLNNIEDGERLVIRGGNYDAASGNDDQGRVLVTPSTLSNLSDGDSFTIELRRDDDSNTDAVEVEEIVIGEAPSGNDNQVDVTVETDGNGFFEQDVSANSPDIDLANGTLTLGATRQLQFANTGSNDIEVERTSASSIANSAPQFDGDDVSVDYELDNGNISADLEVPADLQTGTVDVSDGGNATDNTLTFPSGRFSSFAAQNLVPSNEINVVFEGDFSVAARTALASDQSLTVEGKLTQENTNTTLVANSTGSDAVDLGSLEFASVQGNNTGTADASGALVQGSGVLIVDGEVKFQADTDGGGAGEFVQEVRLEGSTSDFTIGSIDETQVADGTGTGQDSTVVDVINTNGGIAELGGGEIREIDQSSSSGTLEITGDVVANVSDQAVGSDGVDNSGSEATISIADGTTLTLFNDGNTAPRAVSHQNTDDGGFTGDGTLIIDNANGGEQNFSRPTDNDGQPNADIQFLTEIEFTGDSGSNTNTINGTTDGSGPNGLDDGIRIGGNLESDLNGNGSVSLSTTNGDARVADSTIADGGTIDVNSVASEFATNDAELNNSATLDISGTTTAEIRRNFTRTNSNASLSTSGNDSVLRFVASGSDGIFDAQTLFTINGRFEVSKPGAKLTIQEAVEVNGSIQIVDQGGSPRTTLELDDNLFATGGGTFTIDGDYDANGDNQVIFEGSSYTVAGTDTLDNALVNLSGTGQNLNINPDDAGAQSDQTLEFDGEIEVRVGDVEIPDSGEDFAAAADSDAKITRVIDGSGNQEVNPTGSGTFNGLGNEYDLTYTSDATQSRTDPTSSELTDQVRDLEINDGTEVLLDGSSPALSDNNAVVNGALTLPLNTNNANRLNENGSDQTIELAGDGETHQIGAQIEGDGSEVLTVNVSGSSDITGSQNTSASDAAVVENLTVSASGVTTTNLQEIRNDLEITSNGGLTLGMFDEQNVDGDNITVNGDLTLDSAVDVTSASAEVDVANSSAATLNFQSNDLTLTSSGEFDGESDASYESDGGELIFTTSTSDFGTARVAVPRVDINTAAISLTDDAAVSEQLTIDNRTGAGASGPITPVISSSGNGDFVLTGTANFNNSGENGNQADWVAFDANNAGGDAFIAEGTTINVTGGTAGDRKIYLENFTVDGTAGSGSDATVTVQDGDADTNTDILAVGSQFTMASGTLNNTTEVQLEGNLATVGGSALHEFVYQDGTFDGTFIEFQPSGEGTDVSAPSVDFTLDLQADASVPYLRVGDNANFADTDGESLTVSEELELEAPFNQASGAGDLVIANGVDIQRKEGDVTSDSDGTGSGVLDRKPTFEGSYDLEYGDGSSNNSFDSSYEVDDASDTITDIDVNTGSSGEVDFQDAALGGDVTVNGELTLTSGDARFDGSDARQIVMADRATVRRTASGTINNGAGLSLDQTSAPDSYELIYDGTGISADSTEFPANTRLNVVTIVDNTSPTAPGATLNLLPNDETRTVDSLRVANGPLDRTELQDGNGTQQTLTVEGETVVQSGVLGGSTAGTLDGGTLIAEGNVTDAGGDFGRTATIGTAPNTTTGFVGFNLEFAGDQQQLNLNDGDETVDDLIVAQQDAESRVAISGNTLNVDAGNAGSLVLRDGLIVGDSPSDLLINFVNPGGSVPVDHDPNSMSHVVGRIQANPTAGTPQSGGLNRGRFEFPVGNEESYRPVFVTFRTSDPIEANTALRFGHVAENPGGIEGLPIENAGTDAAGDSVSVGSYPDQYWFAQADPGLGTTQSLDLEVRTDGEQIRTDLLDRSELRIIRRLEGQTSPWRLQGDGTTYDNEIDGERVTVRTQNAPGGLTAGGSRFAVGLPTDMPEFLSAPGDTTITEGEVLSGDELTFEATSADQGQDVELTLGDLPQGVAADSVTFDADAPDDTISADFSFTPGFEVVESGQRDLEFTVSAEDSDATKDSTFTVTVIDDNREPAFTASLSDATITDADTLTFTYEASDPDGEDVGYGLAQGPPGASVDTSSGEFSWSPTVDQVGGGPYEVTARVADDDGAAALSDTATVTVEPSLAEGDVDGDGSVTPDDASSALSIFLDGTVGGSPATEAQIAAADLDDNGDVTPNDASLILREFLSSDSGSATASAAKTTARGDVRLKLKEQDGNATRIPVMLSEDASGVQSVGLEVEIGQGASVADVSTDLPDGWIADYAEKEGGTIKVGMAGASPIGGGQIGTIQLKTSDGSSVEPSGEYRLNGGSTQDLDVSLVPEKFALNGNYPNPVESQTTIEYSLKEATDVRISLYDALGREVVTLVNDQKSAGTFEASVDTRDLSSGVYFYRIEAGDFTDTKKMTVVR